jgi:hypothetical protein
MTTVKSAVGPSAAPTGPTANGVADGKAYRPAASGPAAVPLMGTPVYSSGVPGTKNANGLLRSTAYANAHCASDNPMAVTYASTRRQSPSANLLNLMATTVWSDLELSLFVNNALDSQPILQVRNHISTDSLLYARTFRPRTIGLGGKWRF